MKPQNRRRNILNIWLDVPPHVRAIGIRRSLMSLPTQNLLWFYDFLFLPTVLCTSRLFGIFAFFFFPTIRRINVQLWEREKPELCTHHILCIPQLGFKLTIVSWKLEFFWDTSNFPEEKRLNLNYWVFFSFSDGWWEKTWNSCSTLTIDCT